MSLRTAGKALFLPVFLFLLAGCGELDSLFPSNESYQVNVLVNGSSLEDCSLIWEGDEIRPYFADSVENDPDLIGLLVYLQNPQGEIAGNKIQYTLQPYAGDAVYPEIQEEAAEETQEDGENEPGSQDLGPRTARQRWRAVSKPEEETPVVIIPIQSLDREIPSFPLPANMEIGPYSMIIQAIGTREILYHTENDIFYLGNADFSLKDISMYLPGVYDTQLIAPGTTILLESNLDFDSRLEPYVIWYSGRKRISEGKINEGAGAMLWKAPDRAGFYSLRFEVLPFQLEGNFTGIFREITLPVSTKAAAGNKGYFFTDNVDYSANNRLALGTIFGELKQLAAMENTENTEEAVPIPVEQPELLRWYQFGGSLDNTMARYNIEQSLLPSAENLPRWTGAGQSYGLSTGYDDSYLLLPISFFRDVHEEGGGIFLFHVKSLADGTLLSGFFPEQAAADEGVKMEVTRKGNAVVLRLDTAESAAETLIYLPPFESEAFISAAVEFYIRPYHLEAKLSLDGRYSLQSAETSIRLSGVLSGEGIITLGGGEAYSEGEDVPALSPEEQEPADIKTDTPDPTNTIWNEFAVLYSSLPIQPVSSTTQTVVNESLGEFFAAETAAADIPEKEAEQPKTAAEAEVPADQRGSNVDFADTVPVNIDLIDIDHPDLNSTKPTPLPDEDSPGDLEADKQTESEQQIKTETPDTGTDDAVQTQEMHTTLAG